MAFGESVFLMGNQLVYPLISFSAAFASTLYFVSREPKPLWLLLALAAALSVLFDWRYALPGFFLGLGAKVLLSKGGKAWK